MEKNKKWYKNNPEDTIWWLDNSSEMCGWFVFSFDKENEFNLFADYPYKLSREQKEIFDRENPYWFSFFIERTLEYERQNHKPPR